MKFLNRFNINLDGKLNKFSENKKGNVMVCPKSSEKIADTYESDTTMEM